MKASIFVANQSIEEHVTPSVSAYSSHLLALKDVTDEVELVQDSVLKGHQNFEELTMSHEEENVRNGISSVQSSLLLPLTTLLLSMILLTSSSCCLRL